MQLLWLVPLLPLAGAALNLFVGKRLGRGAGVIASVLVGASFVLALMIAVGLLGVPAEERFYVRHLFDWIQVGTFSVGVDLRLDALSLVMILVVTGVALLIHIYSIGYMAEDPRSGRFFAYMNLFVFFMVLLVLAQNYLLLYVGWEGVGLCSYLLIGFWFERTENAEAAKKAFITTRIGDTFMLVGLALLAFKFGTLDFSVIFGSAATAITKATATTIALLLLAGAIGKSAQVPLHVWLPDAMAGPSPVSALIHAATMVTAGVYLVVRSHVLFELSGTALDVVLFVGLFTAIFAATCAIGQDDIKRALAYSTVSQLGFMFLAAGLGAYSLAIFMLVAHAFYKALMFLGAGSVMHGMHEETDMKEMGGLIARMPVTGVTFTIGALALAGLPPLSGFFTKDLILEVANGQGRVWVYVLGMVGALLSAFYIGRLLVLTFFGRPRSEGARQAHEAPPIMWIPLALLALGTATAGYLSLSVEGRLERFLEPVHGAVPEGTLGLSGPALFGIALVVSLAGLAIAWIVYGTGRVDWRALRERLGSIPRLFANGWYVDRAYDGVVIQPARATAAFSARAIDEAVIDGAVEGLGGAVRRLASVGRRLQTGFVRTYALFLFAGAVGVLVYLGFRL
ncbi:MAG: NADH-quinone oxidoreductase subunit L [Actinomycetota bacterium]